MAQVVTPIPAAADDKNKATIIPISPKGTSPAGTSSITPPPAAPQTNPSTDTSNLSTQEIQTMIYELMQMLQVALGQIASINAKMQGDQTAIAQQISDTTHTKTVDYEQKYQAMLDEEAKAHSGFMGFLSDIFGNSIISTILTAIIGALLVETGFGMIMLAGTVALQASGAMDKMTDGVAGVLEKMGIPDTWAQMLAGVIVTALLTAGTGIGEGVSTFGARSAEAAAADTGEVVVSSAGKTATKAVEEVAEDTAQATARSTDGTIAQTSSNATADAATTADGTIAKTSDEAAADTGKAADKSADKAAGKNVKKYWYGGAATAQVFSLALFTTNPVYYFMKGCNASDEVAMWTSVVVNILIALASFKAALSGGKGGTSALGQLMKKLPEAIGPKLESTIYAFQGLCAAGQSGYNMGTGIIQMNTADLYKQLGPVTSDLTVLKALTTVNNSLFTLSQQTLKNSIAAFQTAFSVDLSLDWQAVAQATVEIAG